MLPPFTTKKNDRRIVLPRAKSIALLRPKMQIFKNKLSFNILVACYYIAGSFDIKEREKLWKVAKSTSSRN